MSEEEIRRRMQEARKNPPPWKRELLREIDNLAQQPGAGGVFRGHIRTVATSLVADREQKKQLPRLGQGEEMSLADYRVKYEVKELLGTGPALTVPEKYFMLAAFHDALCEAERMSPIMPKEWQGDVMRQVDFQGRQTKWFRTPDYAACLMYLCHSSQCADLPDQKLQPAVLQQFLEDVRADLEPMVSRNLLWANRRWLALLVLLEAAVVCGAWLWGEGYNLWQKVLASWPYLSGVFVAWLAGFVLLSECGRLLVKRLVKFWKGDPD